MAVGGMVGGGIFSTLGVVIGIAGPWAWLSFATAGLIALAAGYSYVKLASRYGKGGGAFTFLREIDARGFAGSISWILIVGYVLTNSVYAFTFGKYLEYVLGLGPWFSRVSAVGILTLFIGLNLKGVGEAGGVEVALVWFKLAVLVGLAGWGLAKWNPPMLSRGMPEVGLGEAFFGAASVFMAYEGFQLLTYDFEDIETPKKTLSRAVLSAIAVVIAVYIVVALGTAMLIGAGRVVGGACRRGRVHHPRRGGEPGVFVHVLRGVRAGVPGERRKPFHYRIRRPGGSRRHSCAGRSPHTGRSPFHRLPRSAGRYRDLCAPGPAPPCEKQAPKRQIDRSKPQGRGPCEKRFAETRASVNHPAALPSLQLSGNDSGPFSKFFSFFYVDARPLCY